MDYIFEHWTQIIGVLSLLGQLGVIKFVYSLYKDSRQKATARDAALKCLLRQGIYDTYHKGEKDGWLPFYALENATEMYQSYVALEGNGTVPAIYKKITEFPHDPERRDLQ